MTEKYHFPLLSRDDGLALIREKLGLKVAKSKLEADCAQGRGPQPVARFGRRHLYEVDAMLRYGESLIEPPMKMPAGWPRKTNEAS